MARCKVYEVKGPDSARTAGAERCADTAATTAEVDGTSHPICERHDGERWSLLHSDGWLYAFDRKS